MAGKGGGNALNDFLALMYDETNDVSVLRKHIWNWKDFRAIVKNYDAKELGIEWLVQTVAGAPEGFGVESSLFYIKKCRGAFVKKKFSVAFRSSRFSKYRDAPKLSIGYWTLRTF